MATIVDLMPWKKLLVLLPLMGSPAFAEDFSFAPLNRTYRDLVSDFAPLRQGPITLTLSSPNQTLTVQRHVARLLRQADGTFEGRLEIDLEGKGWLIGDVDWSGTGTRFQDELRLLSQTVALTGRASIQRSPGGFTLKTLALPSTVKLKIASNLATEIVTWCDRAAILPWSGLDCRGLERSLTEVSVPLPPPGETYFLSDADLGPEGRARFEAFLKAGPKPGG